MIFTKIKLSGPRVELQWTTERAGTEVKHELTSYESPAPEFVTAMKNFVPEVLDLLELPESFAEGMAVTGLSINVEESGRRGLVVTSLRKLAAFNAPLVLNTPHLREEEDGDQGGKFMPSSLITLMESAQAAAEAFLNGSRAQGDVFAGTASKAKV